MVEANKSTVASHEPAVAPLVAVAATGAADGAVSLGAVSLDSAAYAKTVADVPLAGDEAGEASKVDAARRKKKQRFRVIVGAALGACVLILAAAGLRTAFASAPSAHAATALEVPATVSPTAPAAAPPPAAAPLPSPDPATAPSPEPAAARAAAEATPSAAAVADRVAASPSVSAEAPKRKAPAKTGRGVSHAKPDGKAHTAPPKKR